VGPAGSDRVSRARPYSGTLQGRTRNFAYGAFTLSGAGFHPLPLPRTFVTPRPCCGTIKKRPTTPHRQRPQAIAPTRFGLIPVRSPLLRESRFLSLPRATKMFQFARCTSTAPMDSVQGTRALPRVGFPIRKSPDRRSFSSSPRLIAAIHVLHRLLVPRHPPCALVLLLSRRISRENTNYRYAVFKVRTGACPSESANGTSPRDAVQCRPAVSIARGPVSQSSTAWAPRRRCRAGEPACASAGCEPGVGPARASCRCNSRRVPCGTPQTVRTRRTRAIPGTACGGQVPPHP
jgi:hypothetical protein